MNQEERDRLWKAERERDMLRARIETLRHVGRAAQALMDTITPMNEVTDAFTAALSVLDAKLVLARDLL